MKYPHHDTGSPSDTTACADCQAINTPAHTPLPTPEHSGHSAAPVHAAPGPAVLRAASSADTQKTKSLCCAAAGIIHPVSAPAEPPIPHIQLREAAPTETALFTPNRPPAQPAEGCTHVIEKCAHAPALTQHLPSDIESVTFTEESLAYAIAAVSGYAEFAPELIAEEIFRQLAQLTGSRMTKTPMRVWRSRKNIYTSKLQAVRNGEQQIAPALVTWRDHP